MVTCKTCGGPLDLTAPTCPRCGAEVEMGRLTGILGIVCRSCDAYNEPAAKVCVGCGAPLGKAATSASPASPAAPAEPAGLVATPAATRAPAPDPSAPVVRSFPKAVPPPADLGQRETVSAGPPGLFRGEQPPVSPSAPTVARLGAPVAACPSCGGEAGPGQFCARCGQPLAGRGTGAPAPAAATGTQIFVALAPGRAKLVLERGEGFDGAVFRLNAPEVAAGRSKGAVIFPSDASLAPHHATFFYRDGSLHVRDEGAAGGVFLRLRGLSVPLRTGDLFAVGDHLLRFAGPLPPPPAPPPDGTQRLGSPRPHGAAVLVEEWLDGGVAGRVYLRPGPGVTIGRTGCTINLGDDPWLSQAHAEIQVDADGGAKLRDLGSANGTFLRLPPRSERELVDGDTIRMGREVLRVAVA